jgi:hypothetical protein
MQKMRVSVGAAGAAGQQAENWGLPGGKMALTVLLAASILQRDLRKLNKVPRHCRVLTSQVPRDDVGAFHNETCE